MPKHTKGAHWHTIMSTPLQFMNREFRASFNFVYMTLSLSWRYLFLMYFTTVFFLALVWAGVISGADCYDDMAFRSVYLLLAQQLVGGSSFLEVMDRAPEIQSHGCLFLGFLVSTNMLLLQAFVLSMAVRKFLRPKPALAFSRQLCYNSRDGKPCLQARVINLRATLISDVRVRATWARPTKTSEGETHYIVSELKMAGPQMLRFPGIFTHVIDVDSPLYDAYYKKHDMTGNITLQIIGYDHILDAETHGVWTFSLPGEVALYARFADMVVTSYREAILSGTYRPVLDMANFNRVQHSERAKEALSNLNLSSCPFSHCQLRRSASEEVIPAAGAAASCSAQPLGAEQEPVTPVPPAEGEARTANTTPSTAQADAGAAAEIMSVPSQNRSGVADAMDSSPVMRSPPSAGRHKRVKVQSIVTSDEAEVGDWTRGPATASNPTHDPYGKAELQMDKRLSRAEAVPESSSSEDENVV